MNVARSTSITLPAHVRSFLADVHFATIGTTDPDGAPRQAVTWYLFDGNELVVNSRVGRRWPTNLLRDPRISIAVTDAEDGFRWVGLNGTVEPVTDQARAQADIAAMAWRYEDTADDAEAMIRNFRTMERISFRVRIAAIHDHLD
jgi:PPOX class probable F420-dependent enzyme